MLRNGNLVRGASAVLLAMAILPWRATAQTAPDATFAYPTVQQAAYGCADDECGDDECEDDKKNYGPCGCQARGTLFQWSYGTSFGGGPAGPDEPLVSDRPDFTEASTTVGRGVVQLESGYTYIQDNSNGVTTRAHSFPETLLRVGVFADWLEMRIAWNYAKEASRSAGLATERAAGAEDLYLGMKIALTPQEGILPEMAIIPQMTVPTGARAFTNNETLPGVNWLYAWDFNDFLSLAGSSQINMTLDPSTTDKYLEYAQSFSFGYSLTDKLGAYTEWFAFFPSGADTVTPTHYFDGGFTYSVTNNFQLDIRGGVGLNEAADDFFTGAGFVIRMP